MISGVWLCSFLTSRYVSSVFHNKGSYIGLEEEGAFECVCVCVVLVLFETSIKIINLLLPKFEVVEMLQSTYISLWSSYSFLIWLEIFIKFGQGQLWGKD